MPDTLTPKQFLDACTVAPAVFEMRPDYRALLVVVDGLAPAASGEGDTTVDALITRALAHALDLRAESSWMSCRISRHGVRRTGGSGRGLNAPATASKP